MGKGGEKQNYYTVEYGNSDGAIRFGSLESSLQGVKGEVTSDVKLQGSYEGHYISLDKDGVREGWTLARCPGSFSITCGEYFEGPGKGNAFIVDAKSGDLVLNAGNGDIRIIGRNIELIANGEDNKNGNITLTANETIQLNGKNVNIDAEAAWKFLSSGIGNITCKTGLQMCATFSKCVTGGSSLNSSKYGGKNSMTVVKETPGFI